MSYTVCEREIAAHFRGGMTVGVIPGTGVALSEERFRSVAERPLPEGEEVPRLFRPLFRSRSMEEGNREFSYYIMRPAGYCNGNDGASDSIRDSNGRGSSKNTSRGAIILLHGLNERSWGKYIQWGTRLAAGTGRPVILFPLAWHMNRSPRSWVDRHLMMPLVTARTALVPDARPSTFVNVALSIRMSLSPQLFMLSGYQSAADLTRLIAMLRQGSIPGIGAGGAPDIFAYSIGALMTQVMMLSDPSPLPDESRVMLFCGGCAFSLMQGTSKLIMDSRAFEILNRFYLGWPDGGTGRGGKELTRLMKETPEGEAFYAMTSLKRLKELRNSPFSHYGERLKVITFAGDRVIPPEAVRETLSGCDIATWEPGYQATHEMPFPNLTGERAEAVDRSFGKLFDTADRFFS